MLNQFTEHENTTCGFVAIIGRPNVGKSTLLNSILGKKISITSKKAQTTRHRILGVKTVDEVQTIYVDTPGLHQQERHALNKLMNRTVKQVLRDVEVVVFLVDGLRWTEDDENVLEKLQHCQVPVILAINKVDLIKDKAKVLPKIEKISAKRDFATVVPISALDGSNVEALEIEIKKHLPQGVFLFPPEQITDRDDRFLTTEIVREKLMRFLGEELPYATTVTIELFEDEQDLLKIYAVVFVEREGQKAIVIGDKGAKLKEIGQAARGDLERLFGKKVFLQLWVKVKRGWSDDKNALKSFGYE